MLGLFSLYHRWLIVVFDVSAAMLQSTISGMVNERALTSSLLIVLFLLVVYCAANCVMHFSVLASVPVPMGAYARDLDENSVTDMNQSQFCVADIYSHEKK